MWIRNYAHSWCCTFGKWIIWIKIKLFFCNTTYQIALQNWLSLIIWAESFHIGPSVKIIPQKLCHKIVSCQQKLKIDPNERFPDAEQQSRDQFDKIQRPQTGNLRHNNIRRNVHLRRGVQQNIPAIQDKKVTLPNSINLIRA